MFYQSMKFLDNEKDMCMRVGSLIPSIDELLCDLVTKDLLKRCLTSSLLITGLKSKQVSSIPDIAKAILASP